MVDETLSLFERFKTAAGGDAQAGAMILLAHASLSQPAAKRPARDRMTPPEVAKRFGVSPDTVRGWISSGALKAVNVAGPGKRASHRISPEALEAFERMRTADVQPAVVRRRRKPETDGLMVRRYTA